MTSPGKGAMTDQWEAPEVLNGSGEPWPCVLHEHICHPSDFLDGLRWLGCRARLDISPFWGTRNWSILLAPLLGVLNLTCSASVPWFCSRIQWSGRKLLWEPGYQQVQYSRVYDFRQCWNIRAPTMIPHLKGIQWGFLIFTSLSCSNLTDINHILGTGTSRWSRG